MSGGGSQESSIRWADELDDSDSGLDITPQATYTSSYSQQSSVDHRKTPAKEESFKQKSFECHRADFLASDPQDVSDVFTRRNSRNNKRGGGTSRKPRPISPVDDDFNWRCSSNSASENGRSFASMSSKSEEDRGFYGMRNRRREENSSAW
ncbi:isoform A-like, putative [Babesia ovis]|uniref:Isoform A-like, putative n=1 Tax=Babesia ovis TaxID=5869 RepID=A0A9W5WUR9_BABOV|nr:isoform A-like, putative [Babesia ovis]